MFHFHVAPSYGAVQTNAYCIVLLTFTITLFPFCSEYSFLSSWSLPLIPYKSSNLQLSMDFPLSTCSFVSLTLVGLEAWMDTKIAWRTSLVCPDEGMKSMLEVTAKGLKWYNVSCEDWRGSSKSIRRNQQACDGKFKVTSALLNINTTFFHTNLSWVLDASLSWAYRRQRHCGHKEWPGV